MKFISSLLVAFCFFVGIAAAEEPKDAPPIPEIKKSVDDGKGVIVDVREKEDFDKGHVDSARNIPLSEIKAGNLPADLPKDKTIYTHCMKGGRAAEASKILNEKGYDSMPMKMEYSDVKQGFDAKK